uniref:BLTX831 n=1 Tax=Nephila pilipes TaxID=299642 RepID=A0A076L0H0_NEPPI|nr:BLTX831 [Nephila pilipes]
MGCKIFSQSWTLQTLPCSNLLCYWNC